MGNEIEIQDSARACVSTTVAARALNHRLSNPSVANPPKERDTWNQTRKCLFRRQGTRSTSLFSVTQILIKNKNKSLLPKQSVLSAKSVLWKYNRGRGYQDCHLKIPSILFDSLSGKSSPQGPMLSCCHILPRRKKVTSIASVSGEVDHLLYS